MGEVVTIATAEPIKAAVKHVLPWRERTQVRLATRGPDQADLAVGQRVRLLLPEPPAETEASPLPTDLDRPRSKAERIEWFLATVYCSCGVGGDRCTGMFYTQASCNINACGMPRHISNRVSELIDQGLNDRQIFETLQKSQGPLVSRPHLLP
jgi:hypothetical protein